MKDAKGHGSNPRGGVAAHQSGVENVTHYLTVEKHPTAMPMGKNWFVQHMSGQKIGDIGFTTRKAGQEFVAQHLDPTNPTWEKTPMKMANVYNTARRLNLGIT